MTNPYYNHGSAPAFFSFGSSLLIRTEFDNIAAGFSSVSTDISSIKSGFSYRNWIANSVGINNYLTVISADEVILKNSAGQVHVENNVSMTVDANGTVGSPLSIMSSRVSATLYYIWLWYNSTLGITGTLDISSSSPTPPTGYISTDYKSRMPGPRQTGFPNSYLLQQKTSGNNTIFPVLAGSNIAYPLLIGAGVLGDVNTPTWSGIGLGYCPPTASHILGYLSSGNTSGPILAMLAPSNQYGGILSGSCPPPCSMVVPSGSGGQSSPFRFMIEGSDIYIASSAWVFVYQTGYEENI